MTTLDPDSLEHNQNVLRRIVQKFGGRPAANSYVIRGGEIRAGDAVRLLEAQAKTPNERRVFLEDLVPVLQSTLSQQLVAKVNGLSPSRRAAERSIPTQLLNPAMTRLEPQNHGHF